MNTISEYDGYAVPFKDKFDFINYRICLRNLGFDSSFLLATEVAINAAWNTDDTVWILIKPENKSMNYVVGGILPAYINYRIEYNPDRALYLIKLDLKKIEKEKKEMCKGYAVPFTNSDEYIKFANSLNDLGFGWDKMYTMADITKPSFSMYSGWNNKDVIFITVNIKEKTIDYHTSIKNDYIIECDPQWALCFIRDKLEKEEYFEKDTPDDKTPDLNDYQKGYLDGLKEAIKVLKSDDEEASDADSD